MISIYPEEADAIDDWYQGIRCLTKDQEAQYRLVARCCPIGHPTKIVGCRPYCDTCDEWFHFHQTVADAA